jgi:cytochrome P450
MAARHYDPFREDRDDPFPYYAEARSRCPVAFNPGLGAYVVMRHDDVVHVLNDPKTFSSRVAIPEFSSNPPEVQRVLGPQAQSTLGVRMVVADPPEHGELKRTGSWLFRRERVDFLAPRMRDLAHDLIKSFIDDRGVELVSRFADPFAYNVLCDLLGIPAEDRDQVRAWTDQMLLLLDPSAHIDGKMAAAADMRAWQEYTQKLVAVRAAHPEHDLISEMLGMGRESEVRFYLEGALAAGIYTTRDLIASCVLTLMQPDLKRYWHQAGSGGPAVASALLEETMRRDAPHKGLSRITTRDTDLAGVDIPAGSLVMPLVGSANRDERVFAAPDSFDPGRENLNQHLALGRGIHLCIGAYLARTAGAIALETLARQLPEAQLASGFVAEYFPSPFFRGLQAVQLAW